MLNTDIIIKPSKRFIALLLAKIAIIVVSAILFLSVSLLIKIIFIFITGSYGMYVLWANGFLQSKNSIVAMRLLNNGTWMLYTKETVLSGELWHDSLVTAQLMVLRFALPGRWWKRSVVLFKDSLKPSMYRELFVHIRFGQ